MASSAVARALRRQSTDAERALWRLLRADAFRAYKFRRQEPIGRYVADFVCYRPRLVIEADGAGHERDLRDLIRDRWLTSQGFCVLRFTDREVLTEPSAIGERIWQNLHES